MNGLPNQPRFAEREIHKNQRKFPMDPQNVASNPPVVHEFLRDLFGNDWPEVWVAGVPGDPNDRANVSFWKGGRAGDDIAYLFDDQNLYYSVSVVRGGSRKASAFVKAPVVVIDDVGSKVADVDALLASLGQPRWAIETSPGNEQWVFRLAKPIEDARIFERIMKALAAKGWTDPGAIDVTRAMRLPAGINGKPKYGSPSPKVIVSTGPEACDDDLDFVDLCRALDLDPIETLDVENAPVVSAKEGGRADMTRPDAILRALMDLGRVLGPGRETGMVDICCPFDDEHTAREDSGTAYFGGGAFKCHHGHCQGRTNWDFKAKVQALYDEKNGSGAFTTIVFDDELSGDEDQRVEAAKAAADAKEQGEVDAEKALLAAMGRRYALVEGERSIIDLRGSETAPIVRVTREAFVLTNDARRRVGKGRSETGVGTFALKTPGVLRVFDRIDMIDPPGSEPAGVLNLWRGFAVTPAAGKWDRINELIENTIASGDKSLAGFILDWIAHGLQNPLERAGTALCLVGSQGTGKSTVGEILRRTYGLKYSIHASADNDLVGSFNDRLENRLLFVGDEAVFGGDPRIKGRIKSLITESALRIEGKFQSAREVRNRLKFLFTSNELAALPIEPGDRRSTIVRVSDRRKGDAEYWLDLHDHLDEELPGFLHGMLARDLSGFDHRKPRATGAKADMAEATATPLIRFLLGAIDDDGTAPGADWMMDATGASEDWDTGPVRVRFADLFAEFERWARRNHIRHVPARSVLGLELRSLIPNAVEQKPRINGKQERTVILPAREDCRLAIRQSLGAGADG